MLFPSANVNGEKQQVTPTYKTFREKHKPQPPLKSTADMIDAQ
jgi:hypothetical protein